MSNSRVYCGKCSKVVSDTSKSILCDGICNKWYHAKCASMTHRAYKKISQLGDTVLWYCATCRRGLRSSGNSASELCPAGNRDVATQTDELGSKDERRGMSTHLDQIPGKETLGKQATGKEGTQEKEVPNGKRHKVFVFYTPNETVLMSRSTIVDAHSEATMDQTNRAGNQDDSAAVQANRVIRTLQSYYDKYPVNTSYSAIRLPGEVEFTRAAFQHPNLYGFDAIVKNGRLYVEPDA